jgi:hypothetical protein
MHLVVDDDRLLREALSDLRAPLSHAVPPKNKARMTLESPRAVGLTRNACEAMLNAARVARPVLR